MSRLTVSLTFSPSAVLTTVGKGWGIGSFVAYSWGFMVISAAFLKDWWLQGHSTADVPAGSWSQGHVSPTYLWPGMYRQLLGAMHGMISVSSCPQSLMRWKDRMWTRGDQNPVRRSAKRQGDETWMNPPDLKNKQRINIDQLKQVQFLSYWGGKGV